MTVDRILEVIIVLTLVGPAMILAGLIGLQWSLRRIRPCAACKAVGWREWGDRHVPCGRCSGFGVEPWVP